MEELRSEFQKETNIAPVFAERGPYIDYIRWLEGKLSQALRIHDVSKAFYCQSDIEMGGICDKQCEHCNEYYKPLEQ